MAQVAITILELIHILHGSIIRTVSETITVAHQIHIDKRPFDEAVNANIPVWMTENCDNLKRSEDWNDAMKWARNFHY